MGSMGEADCDRYNPIVDSGDERVDIGKMIKETYKFLQENAGYPIIDDKYCEEYFASTETDKLEL